MKCSIARRLIDEVDNPANLPRQAAGHLEGCTPCRQFAAEREQLRKLLLEPVRVSAPANFEAIVAQRLAKRVDEKRPFWLAGGFYLRAAGAAAALASLILVAQVTMLKRVPSTSLSLKIESTVVPPTSTTPKSSVEKPPHVITPTRAEKGALSTGSIGPRRRFNGPSPGATISAAFTNIAIQPRALLLVRNPGSEHEVAVPMVSVGAQPWPSVSLQAQEGIRAAF